MRVILAIMLLALIGSICSATKLTVATDKQWDLTYGTNTTTNLLVYTLSLTQSAAFTLSTTAAATLNYFGGACFYTTSSSNLTFALNATASYNAFAWHIACTPPASDSTCDGTGANTLAYKMGATTGAKWVSNTALTLTGYADCTGLTGTPAISGNSMSVTATHTAACGPTHDSSWYGYCWNYGIVATDNLVATAITGYSDISAAAYVSQTSSSSSTSTSHNSNNLVNAAGVVSIALVVSFF